MGVVMGVAMGMGSVTCVHVDSCAVLPDLQDFRGLRAVHQRRP